MHSGFSQLHPDRTGAQVRFPIDHGSMVPGVLTADDSNLASDGEPRLPELAVRQPRQRSVVIHGDHLPCPGYGIWPPLNTDHPPSARAPAGGRAFSPLLSIPRPHPL
jgi:hypothetical protein